MNQISKIESFSFTVLNRQGKNVHMKTSNTIS